MYWQRIMIHKLVHAQLGISSVSGRYLVQIAGGAKIKLPVLVVIYTPQSSFFQANFGGGNNDNSAEVHHKIMRQKRGFGILADYVQISQF